MLWPVITPNTDNESDKPAPLEKGSEDRMEAKYAVDRKKRKRNEFRKDLVFV